MARITLHQASTIVDSALQEARRLNLSPLGVVVLDEGGNLIVFKREDRAGLLRFDIAYGKAWGSLGMGIGSRELTERAPRMGAFFQALTAVSQGRVVPSPGGVLSQDAAGEIVGAAGASGDTGDKDEACLIAGIKAAGLNAIPGVVER
jgi:uncharacterized protein GlcG (DUF336 family)